MLGGYFVAEIASAETTDNPDELPNFTFHTYLISAESGHAVYIGAQDEQIYAVTEQKLIMGKNSPFPQLILLIP